MTPMMFAAKGDSPPKKKVNHIAVIKLLKKFGADIDQQNEIDVRDCVAADDVLHPMTDGPTLTAQGNCALHYAVIYGFETPEIFRSLLELGANPLLEDKQVNWQP
jgi:ankyrin repeat protein